MTETRDHGGGLDAAMACWGGQRGDWIDLSTGINPHPYPVGQIPNHSWTALPDEAAFKRLETAARRCWDIPPQADILAAPGASALIAQMPSTLLGQSVNIPAPTYNEHKAAFDDAGWSESGTPDAIVIVHPNNPDGRLWDADALTAEQIIIDESFCDVTPDQSLINLSHRKGVIILKSFGKFWGLAGLRLGFAIGDPVIIAMLRAKLGPWQISGPALEIGATALEDINWAEQTRTNLFHSANRLDALMTRAGATPCGGTTLFRLYETKDAAAWQNKLAEHHIWSRIFPYSKTWLRLGLPPSDRWAQLENAL